MLSRIYMGKITFQISSIEMPQGKNFPASWSTHLQRGQLRGALSPREGELGLDKDFLNVVFLGIKLVVDLGDIIQPKPVREHLSRIQFAPLDLGE